MAEPKAESSRFILSIEAGEEFWFVPSERAIVGTKGIFVLNLELMVGTPVVIQVRKKQAAVSLPGIVCANYRDLGLAIRFKETTGRAARQLLTLLAA